MFTITHAPVRNMNVLTVFIFFGCSQSKELENLKEELKNL